MAAWGVLQTSQASISSDCQGDKLLAALQSAQGIAACPAHAVCKDVMMGMNEPRTVHGLPEGKLGNQHGTNFAWLQAVLCLTRSQQAVVGKLEPNRAH